MFTARLADDARPPVDALLPRRRRGSKTLGVALGTGLLVAAWVSPQVLRPQLTDVSPESWSAEPGADVVSTAAVDTDAWPWVALTDIDDAPGARVVSVVVQDRISDTPLRRLRSGDDAVVVVRWRVTDCSALRARERPVARLRGPLGTTTTQRLPAIVGPDFDMEALRSSGTCPAE